MMTALTLLTALIAGMFMLTMTAAIAAARREPDCRFGSLTSPQDACYQMVHIKDKPA